MLGQMGCYSEQVARPMLAWQALEAAVERGTPFDLLLFDGPTLGEEALVFTEQLGESLGPCQPQMLALTARGTPMGNPAWTQAKGHYILHKPLKQSQLFQMISKIAAGEVIPPAEPTVETLPVTLPLSPAAAAAGGRILLAEDNSVNQHLAVKLLQKAVEHFFDLRVT